MVSLITVFVRKCLPLSYHHTLSYIATGITRYAGSTEGFEMVNRLIDYSELDIVPYLITNTNS